MPTAAPSALTPDVKPLVDRIVERNARLIVRLTHVQRELHETRHARTTRWHRCQELSCRATRACIETNSLEGSL